MARETFSVGRLFTDGESNEVTVLGIRSNEDNPEPENTDSRVEKFSDSNHAGVGPFNN